MNARDGMRRLRAERKERGVCHACGLNRPDPGRTYCPECLIVAKRYRDKAKLRSETNGMHTD